MKISFSDNIRFYFILFYWLINGIENSCRMPRKCYSNFVVFIRCEKFKLEHVVEYVVALLLHNMVRNWVKLLPSDMYSNHDDQLFVFSISPAYVPCPLLCSIRRRKKFGKYNILIECTYWNQLKKKIKYIWENRNEDEKKNSIFINKCWDK